MSDSTSIPEHEKLQRTYNVLDYGDDCVLLGFGSFANADNRALNMPSTIAVEGMEVSAEIFDGPGWATAIGSRRQKIPPYEELAARTVEHNTQPKGPRGPKRANRH
ncbi:hypothetical protein MTO96_037788, partial [Rhipicephalus appendiculatus]